MSHPLDLLKRLNLKCRGIIHVGANLGQEFETYQRNGLQSVVYIEPIPAIFAKLQARVSEDSRHIAINAVCTNRYGDEIDFFIASNNGESSSIFEFGSHAELHPEVIYQSKLRIQTTTLDRIIFETPAIKPALLDCLVIDVQGAEAKVLAGGIRTLGLCNFVFVEVSEGGLYKGDVPFEEIITFLQNYDFRLKSFDLNLFGWGNAFFAKVDKTSSKSPI